MSDLPQHCTDILYFCPEDQEKKFSGVHNDQVDSHYNVFTIPGK